MTKRDRVKAAIKFEKMDFFPYSIMLTNQMKAKMTEYTGIDDFVNTIGNHILMSSMSMPFVEIKPGFFRDEFGVIWNRTGADKNIGVVDNLIIKEIDDLDNYELPSINENYLREKLDKIQSDPQTRFRVAELGFSLFERAWTLRGMENLLCDMMIDPEFVHALLDRITERNLKIIDIAMEYDIDAMYFGDDWGMQKGLIMGAKSWRSFIKPCLQKMYDRVHKAGKYVIQHSCGDVRDVMDDLIELGLNVYQTFQPEIYGYDYAEKLRGHIAIWGGISTQRDLPFKNPDEIKSIVFELMSHFQHGGLIVAPTHEVPSDAKPENIIAMVDILRNQ